MVAKTCSKCGSPLQSVANGTMLSCKHCGTMVFANDDTHSDLAEMYLRTELTNGDKLLFEQKWAEAVTCFSNLTEKYPLDIDSWMGLARAMTREQTFMALSGAEYQRLTKCLSKIQLLQGALLDDSWRQYRQKYEEYRDIQRMEIQEQCEKLARWIDSKQDGDSKMAALIGMVAGAFLVFMLGVVIVIIEPKAWMVLPITTSISVIIGWMIYRIRGKADITKEERQRVKARCAELEKQAKYWNVNIFFRQDIRNILESKK